MGAINTIVNDDGYLRQLYNTGGTGHIRAIKESGFDSQKGRAMVLLGAGGASTAAIGAQGQLKV